MGRAAATLGSDGGRDSYGPVSDRHAALDAQGADEGNGVVDEAEDVAHGTGAEERRNLPDLERLKGQRGGTGRARAGASVGIAQVAKPGEHGRFQVEG